MYDVHDFDAMFADDVRTNAQLAAIARAVRPGSVVVEIGTGVGFFAVAAVRAGAGRVYAIEMNPAVDLAAAVASENDCADGITFIRGESRRVVLPERGDLLLSDLRGVLPLYGDHIPVLIDARSRFIKPGASMIPLSDSMWAAPCAAPAEWRQAHIAPGDAPHGIGRRTIAARVRADWHRCHLAPPDLLADGAEWARLEYESIESPDVTGRAAWTFARDGIADGLAIWFDGDLGFGVTMSNAPSAPRALYGQAFFPFERSLPVRAGDRLAAELHAKHVGGAYVWGWDTLLTPCGHGEATVAFRQSNLAAHVGTLAALGRIGADHRPRRPASAPLMRTLLELADGSRTLGEIAAALGAAHPREFADTTAALRFARTRLGSLDDEDDLTFPTIPSTG